MIEWIYPVGKPLVLETVAYLFRVERLFHFFCSKSKSIPCLTASARVVSCFTQYSSSRSVVSSSNRTLITLVFGFSAFGLPVRGDIFFTSLFVASKVLYFSWPQKSRGFFNFFQHIEEGNRFSPVPLKIGLWPKRHSRHLFCPLPKGVWRMGTLFPPQSPFLSYLKYSSIIPACKGFSCSSHSSSMWFHQFARKTRWSFDIQRGHSLPLPVESL